jgi:hypothetical protein
LPKQNETPDQEAPLQQKLDLIIRLLAALLVKGSSNDSEAISKLAILNLSPKEIASVVGVSSHHASQVIYSRKKAGKKTNSAAKVSKRRKD